MKLRYLPIQVFGGLHAILSGTDTSLDPNTRAEIDVEYIKRLREK